MRSYTDGADDVDDVFGSVYDGADVTTQRLVLRMRTHIIKDLYAQVCTRTCIKVGLTQNRRKFLVQVSQACV